MPGEPFAFFGLTRPTVADVRVAVGRTHGRDTTLVWAQLLAAAGLTGHETDETALNRLLDAMTERDPLSRVTARSMRVRLSSYGSLAATHRQLATAGSFA